MIPITGIKHPYYQESQAQWYKWRTCYNGGDTFKNEYLKHLSKRESAADFIFRKEISYSPSFAKVAINEVRNSIFQRLSDITRSGGPRTYRSCIDGLEGGVDRRGSSMNGFLGFQVLPELLVMGSVGIFVDKEPKRGPTIADNQGLRPYLYTYPVESICNWDYNSDNELTNLLLEETDFKYDEGTNLPVGYITTYRHFVKEGDMVIMSTYSVSSELLSEEVLEIDRIPFIMPQLSASMMADIADYQISLLNLASADMSFALRANNPFYVEQVDPNDAFRSAFMRKGLESDDGEGDGSVDSAESSDTEEITVGSVTGRRVAKGLTMPEFIHPSSEPMKASMEKQEQLKAEIRLLLSLSIANLAPVRASDKSKEADDRGLESGLSCIGLELEYTERCIGEIWGLYENEAVPFISYPQTYKLKTDSERQDEAGKLVEFLPKVPTSTGRREISKKALRVLLENTVDSSVMSKIEKEIDEAVNIISDPILITEDVDNGLVSPETASLLRGYPAGEADKAKKAAIEKAKAIALAQSSAKQSPDHNPADTMNGDPSARGLPELSVNKKASRQEKKGKNQRGQGRTGPRSRMNNG